MGLADGLGAAKTSVDKAMLDMTSPLMNNRRVLVLALKQNPRNNHGEHGAHGEE